MAYVFFPSCKATAQFKGASEGARDYVRERFGIDPIGCCRPNHRKLGPGDTAIVVRPNCSAIIEENTDAEIRSLWQVVDDDPVFPFPHYGGWAASRESTCWSCRSPPPRDSRSKTPRPWTST